MDYRRDHVLMEFHVSRRARDRYAFDHALFTLSGNVIFANFRGARIFAQKMNEKRDLIHRPEDAVKAGQLNALGLIDEILHYIAQLYREQINPEVMGQALAHLESQLGAAAVDAALRRFTDDFPPLAVYRGEVTAADYLAGSSAGVSNRQLVLEELLMLWLENANPACASFRELFDDAALAKATAYRPLMAALGDFFAAQPFFGPDNQPLVEMLRAPAIAVPYSLSGQLEYILTHWAALIGKYLYRLLSGLDLIKEEEKAIFLGPGPSLVDDYSSLGGEPEAFSADKDWMPRVVLMAKNIYVWLDQLSKKYRRSITRLDEIPDEELDTLARWGFTGLWLIGVWERSRASQRIKQWCGNPEAVASAYSLLSYDPADDLGGDAALENLRARAWRRGIRMASDMVPNHMGIDSNWVIEHPDWFIGLDYSPFPSYSFNSGNVSNDDRVGIYIEDHYYTRNDAAVVFKRVDHHTGATKYIYHGNDGTSMPWNDTAQLNYLLPEVREAVIQTILHVARNFPIIRFDAAMTLAKKHYQRLWFPEPGTGGAIPSRAEHGLTRPDFNAVFPKEFWREVVDRVAREVPDTLLLAEAFWLMEGYFVRTLGMHRVYNSAFMNMLRDEDNAKYRSVMKNTMEFDPEVLKRLVNFMNNPDERTAIDQFGKEDKYFGVCTLMATLPGLPMFGHGQIEGFTEKYGMEYRRAYWDEQVDGHLVWRHEREIFPLLHHRPVFAGVDNFLLYDFFTPEGWVNEDVFAYSNRLGDERGLVIYHNKFASVRGWIKTSAAYAVKTGDGKTLTQRSLGDGLTLHADGAYYTIFRDARSGLEFIRNSKEIHDMGLFVELSAYQSHVFLDFREVHDNEWQHYAHLCAYLGGRGVPSIDEALREIILQPLHQPYRALVNGVSFTGLLAAYTAGQPDAALLETVEAPLLALLVEVKRYGGGDGDEAAVAAEIRASLDAVLRLPALTARIPGLYPGTALAESPALCGALFGWTYLHALGKMAAAEDYAELSRDWMDEWLLGRLLADALRDMGLEEAEIWRAVTAVRLLVAQQNWFDRDESAAQVLTRWLSDIEVQQFLQVNRHQDVLWFGKEAMAQWLALAGLTAAVSITTDPCRTAAEQDADLHACAALLTTLRQAEAAAAYQVDKLLEAVEDAAGV